MIKLPYYEKCLLVPAKKQIILSIVPNILFFSDNESENVTTSSKRRNNQANEMQIPAVPNNQNQTNSQNRMGL